MTARRVAYLDSSAIVKLVVREPESAALRRAIRQRTLISSALARTEVPRAVLHLGDDAVRRAMDVLGRIELVRINDRVLATAAELRPAPLRSLDAIHLATAGLLGDELQRVVTYDERMSDAADALGFTTTSPR